MSFANCIHLGAFVRSLITNVSVSTTDKMIQFNRRILSTFIFHIFLPKPRTLFSFSDFNVSFLEENVSRSVVY